MTQQQQEFFEKLCNWREWQLKKMKGDISADEAFWDNNATLLSKLTPDCSGDIWFTRLAIATCETPEVEIKERKARAEA